MDRLTAAAELAVKAADVEDMEDVEDKEDDTRQKNVNWRSSKWKMKHCAASWPVCNPPKARIHLVM
jgi:hypothetical protein